MGYEVERFIKQVDDEFLCSICLGVFESPVHGPCGHTFCLKCIENWIPVNVNACPLDKKPLFKKDLTPVSLPFRNLLNRLDIKCEFEAMGCMNVCQMSRLASHIKMCPFNPDGEMVCDQGCDLTFPRRERDQHKCIPALKEIVAKQRIEIADLQKKLGNNKRNYDQAFFSRYASGDRLASMMEFDDLARRRASLRAELVQERVRSNLMRSQQLEQQSMRSRTPPPAHPSSSSPPTATSSNSRIIAQLSAAPSASTSRYGTAMHLASRLSTSGHMNIREMDLPQLEVHVRRLTDEDLESYGLPRLSSTSTAASSTLREESLQASLLRRRLNSLAETSPVTPINLDETNASSSQLTSASSSIPSSSSQDLATQSTQASSSSSSANSSPSNHSSQRFDLLTAMLSSRGTGCSSTRND